MDSSAGYSVAIVGATGAVGEALLEILQERNFPVSQLYLLASERSAGKRLQFHGKSVQVQRLDEFDFPKHRSVCFLRVVRSPLNMLPRPLRLVVWLSITHRIFAMTRISLWSFLR